MKALQINTDALNLFVFGDAALTTGRGGRTSTQDAWSKHGPS